MGNVGKNLFQQTDNNVIKITCDDNSMTGVLVILEWHNVQPNTDGKYNMTQFISKYGGNEGSTNDIIIKDGKAEYNLHNDTDFFMVAPYITGIKLANQENASNVYVELLHNGESIVTSYSKTPLFGDESQVSFGLQVYSVNGTKLSDSDLNIDIPELKNAFNFETEGILK